VVGMVGVLPDPQRAGRLAFATAGDAIARVGWDGPPSAAASELAKLRGEPLPDGLEPIDVAAVVRTLDAVRAAVRAGDLTSAHDIAEGGLLVAVAESCLAGGLGATLDLGTGGGDPWVDLFGEHAGGFVVSAPAAALERLAATGVPVDVFGTVGGDGLEVTCGAEHARWPLPDLRAVWGALAPLFP
jgi:phosphoribosylformylglycinamidine synthase subunit PurL